MSEDKKTILEALAEVQKNAEQKRIAEAKKAWGDALQVDEAAMPGIKVGGKKVPTSTKPATTTAANQNTPGSSSGVSTAANIATGASMLPKKMLGGAAVGAAASELGKEIAFGSEKARQLGHEIYKNVPGAAEVSDAMLKTREYLGIPSTAPKEYQRTSTDLPKIDVPAAPKAETPKPEAPKSAPKAETPSSFGAAFKAAREKATTAGHASTGQFDYQGKQYQTNVAGEKYVPMSQQSKVSSEDGKKKKVSEETVSEMSAFDRAFSQNMKSKGEGKTFKWHGKDILLKYADNKPKAETPLPPKRPADLGNKPTSDLRDGRPMSGISPAPTNGGISPAPKAPETNSTLQKLPLDTSKPLGSTITKEPFDASAPSKSKLTNLEYESGGKKAKKMSEETNPLIASFLDLQAKNPSNMFEAAKKLSKKQDEKLDVVDDDKIDAKDLAALRAGKKKVDEANIDPVVTGSSSVTKDPKKYVDPSTPKVPYSELPKPGNAAGDVLSKAKNALDKTGVKEEVEQIDEIGDTKAGQKALKSYVKKAGRSSEKNAKILFNPSNPTYRAAEKGKPGAEEKYSAASVSYHNRLKGMEAAKKRIKEENEEVTFSQAEIDHINSFFLEASVAPVDPETTEAKPTSEKLSQNDLTATAESGKKIRKEEVEQIEEGRPKKNPEPETTERDPRKHIQVEAGRAAAGNVVDFHHNDGTTSKITPGMGRRITSHLNGLKPADRQAAVNKMHDSAEGLKV